MGAVWGAILLSQTSTAFKTGSASLRLIDTCEQALPRVQNCILVALPEEIKEKYEN